MDKDKNRNFALIAAAAIFAAAIVIIAAVFMMISRSSAWTRINVSARKPENAHQVPVAANSGGYAPTPEPLQGMDSPTLCKLEFAGLHNKASKIGAPGMLLLDSYDIAKDTCIFELRSPETLQSSAGKIELFRKKTGEYGIRITISEKMEDAIQKWGEAALLFFNAGITEKTAEESIREAITEGKSDSPLYTISTRKDILLDKNKVEPALVLEIRSGTIVVDN